MLLLRCNAPTFRELGLCGMLLREPAATADSSCVADILPTLAPPPQCPNLRELDLSECRLLTDAVFESLGAGAGPSGYLGGGELNPGGWVGG